MGAEQSLGGRLRRFRDDHPPSADAVSWHVRRLLHCIHEHVFDAGLNVRTLKLHCGLRDNNISCRFKNEVGVPIKTYIEHLRLDAASQLLQGGVFSVSEVAHAVGYPHLQTFYRVYARRFGRTPGRCREPVSAVEAAGAGLRLEVEA